MARTLYADGTTGKVFIYKGEADPSLYTVPTPSQLKDLHFHSDLSYLGAAQILDVALTHPERKRSTSTSKGLFGDTVSYNPQQGSQSFELGPHAFGRIVPCVAFYGAAQMPSGTVIQQVGESVRAVSVGITASQIRAFETWATFDEALPAFIQSYRVILFETLFEGTGTESISITPNAFRAGFGKLSTSYRYFKASADPSLYLTADKTADVQGGGLRVVLPDGTIPISTATYTGQFDTSSGRGISL